ncbi:MAG: DUF1116 domain-containing protein [Candidatus Thorarchaeota archaeon]
MNIKESISNANSEALQKMNSVTPYLVDIKEAIEIIPGMTKNTILHAGPPIEWDKMCDPMKGAIAGILVYENLVNTFKEGYEYAKDNLNFSPNHDLGVVGPMTGITAPHQPVFVLEDRETGKKSFCTLNEGRGKVLRFGGWDESVLTNLLWMKEILAPILKKAIVHSGGINIKQLIAESLHMGDEAHNRNRSGTYLFLSQILPHILDTETDHELIKEVIGFIVRNADIFHLNLSMPHSKLIADAAREIEYCSLVVALARNGVETGIQVSGLGRKWFTSPAPLVSGLYFPGYSINDSCPDLGDSTITETIGLGGFSMANAPAIVNFVGGSSNDAIKRTEMMYEITAGRNTSFTIPILDFKTSPMGIDIRKVVESNQPPLINTGISHKKAGIGQIGAGLTEAPLKMFIESLKAFAGKYNVN